MEFDRLYDGRDEGKYPNANPMRDNALIPLHDKTGRGIIENIRLPDGYKIHQSLHGVNHIDFENPNPNYELRTDLKDSKCPDVLEVSETECLGAALLVDAYYNPINDLTAGDWDHTPCGCFLWGPSPSKPHYDRGNQCSANTLTMGIVCKRSFDEPDRYEYTTYQNPGARDEVMRSCDRSMAVSNAFCAAKNSCQQLLYNLLTAFTFHSYK